MCTTDERSGRRNLFNQSFSNFIAIYSDVLLLIREISGKLVTVLTQVRARDSIACAATVIFNGPIIKSTVTSDHFNNNALLDGSSPKNHTQHLVILYFLTCFTYAYKMFHSYF
jgi:hypothetical protein